MIKKLQILLIILVGLTIGFCSFGLLTDIGITGWWEGRGINQKWGVTMHWYSISGFEEGYIKFDRYKPLSLEETGFKWPSENELTKYAKICGFLKWEGLNTKYSLSPFAPSGFNRPIDLDNDFFQKKQNFYKLLEDNGYNKASAHLVGFEIIPTYQYWGIPLGILCLWLGFFFLLNGLTYSIKYKTTLERSTVWQNSINTIIGGNIISCLMTILYYLFPHIDFGFMMFIGAENPFIIIYTGSFIIGSLVVYFGLKRREINRIQKMT